MNIKKRVWELIEVGKPGDPASRLIDWGMLSLIILNVLASIFGTVSSIQNQYGTTLNRFEVFSVTIFTVEYIGRIWSCTASPLHPTGFLGRIRFALRPMLIIDLLAILPFFLPFVECDLRTLRVLRVLRILRIAKVGRYYSSLALIKQVLHNKKEELVLTSMLMGLLLLFSSSILYFCENAVQPEKFSSIPATMWWSIATLTTVGYGDVYPITVLGRIFAGLVAFLGVGMFALPAGILGAGFVEAIQNSKAPQRVCPHCGKPL